MTLTVLGPRILVRPTDLPEMSSSGLSLVHGRRKSAVQGVVVAVGDGPDLVNRAVGGTLDAVADALEGIGFQGVEAFIETVKVEPREHMVQVGNTVMFSPEAGEELHFERDLLLAMTEDDVIAIIEQGESCE